MKNILVALDLIESDTSLLYQAEKLSKKFHSKLWIVHVAAPEPDFVGYSVGPKYIRDSRAEELKKEHHQLKAHCDDLEKRKVACEGLLIQGPTVQMLEEEVKKLNIDLVIMGNHRRGFFYDALVGNTSTKLLRQLTVPVMMVPLED